MWVAWWGRHVKCLSNTRSNGRSVSKVAGHETPTTLIERRCEKALLLMPRPPPCSALPFLSSFLFLFLYPAQPSSHIDMGLGQNPYSRDIVEKEMETQEHTQIYTYIDERGE